MGGKQLMSCQLHSFVFGPSERIKNKSQPYFTSKSLKLPRKLRYI